MRPYILAETNWKSLKEKSFELAILPWGATEAHNYHMPYATDVIEADHIAAESARKAWEKGARVVVLPTIPFGVNTGQSDIYLDINMNPSTQMAILNDVITVLNRQGIKKFMVLNSHGGNDFKTMLRELGLKYPEMFLCMTNWFRLPDKMKYFENEGDHADEMESSLLLHLRPDLVLPKKEWGDGAEKKNKIRGFREGWAWAERPWSKITEDTGVGDPSQASAEKGKRYFEYVTGELAELMMEICANDPDKLYE
jgi:creatinine amidohydrolase